MRKLLNVIVVLAFAWLQTYQLCDASEDMIEALPACDQVVVGHCVFFSHPVIPDDDADAQIPQIFDRALRPCAVSALLPVLSPLAMVAVPQRIVTLAPHVAMPKDLSPPGAEGFFITSLGLSNHPFIVSAQSLAPPAV